MIINISLDIILDGCLSHLGLRGEQKIHFREARVGQHCIRENWYVLTEERFENVARLGIDCKVLV